MIIDATDLIAGRLATFVAKQALLGEKIDIINCEKAVISGTESKILAHYKRKKTMGIPSKGPFLSRMPDRFLKRLIRGMLPYKQEKGKLALKRITPHIGVPENLSKEKVETLEKIKVSKLPNEKYITIQRICKSLGALL